MSEEEAIERLKERVKLDRKIRNNKIESDYEQFCENECQAIETILNLADKQQKEIKKEKSRIMELAELLDKQENEIKSLEQELEIQEGCSISKDKIRERIKELEEQKEKLKYDGDRCFADYEQFCKKLKFFKEQIEELLEEK